MDKGNPIKDHLPALAIGALIIVLAIAVPRFLRVAPSTPEDVSSDAFKSFENDCVDLVLKNGDILPACASADAIRSTYHLDVRALLVHEQQRRIDTAQKVAQGEITDGGEYRQCVKRGECVEIPGMNTDIDPRTPEGKAARAEFRHLVDSGSITEQGCDAIDLCRALVKIGIIPQPRPLAARS
jgi:hypothetical protein